MKFIIIAIVLISAVIADVSHLQRNYLPPVLSSLKQTQHISYAKENQEIPQASVQEVIDNSVVESVAAAEQNSPNYSGQFVVETPHLSANVNSHITTNGVLAQHIKKADDLAHQVHAHVKQTVATVKQNFVEPVSATYEVKGEAVVGGSNFGGSIQGNIQSSGVIDHHEQNAAAIAHEVKSHFQEAIGTISASATDDQNANGLSGDFSANNALAQQVQNVAALAQGIKSHAVTEVAEEPAAPGSDVYESTKQQTEYYTQNSQQNEQEIQQKETKQYYTGAIIQQHDEINSNVDKPEQEHQNYYYVQQHVTPFIEHNVEISVPSIHLNTQQQQANFYEQQSYAVDSAAADTQYADNGGYIY